MADVLALVKEASTTQEASFEELQAAISAGGDVNGGLLEGKGVSATPLGTAVQAQNPALVTFLLNSRADPCLPDRKGGQPLHFAAFFGHSEILQSLLEARADPNGRDRHGQTPLFFAVNKDTCQQLAKAGADLNHRNNKGQTAMHLAAHGGLTEVVQWLTQNMNSGLVNVPDKHGRTAFYCSTKSSDAPSLGAVLKVVGATPHLLPHKAWKTKPAAESRQSSKTAAVMLDSLLQKTKLETAPPVDITLKKPGALGVTASTAPSSTMATTAATRTTTTTSADSTMTTIAAEGMTTATAAEPLASVAENGGDSALHKYDALEEELAEAKIEENAAPRSEVQLLQALDDEAVALGVLSKAPSVSGPEEQEDRLVDDHLEPDLQQQEDKQQEKQDNKEKEEEQEEQQQQQQQQQQHEEQETKEDNHDEDKDNAKQEPSQQQQEAAPDASIAIEELELGHPDSEPTLLAVAIAAPEEVSASSATNEDVAAGTDASNVAKDLPIASQEVKTEPLKVSSAPRVDPLRLQELEAQELKIQRLEDRTADLTARLEAGRARKAKLETEAESLERQAEAGEQARKELEQQLEELRQKCAEEDAERERLEKEELSVLRRQQEESELERQKLEQEAGDLRQRCQAQEADRAQLEEEASSLRRKVAEHEAEKQRIEQESQTLRQKVAEEDSERVILLQELADVKKKIADQQTARLKYESEAEELAKQEATELQRLEEASAHVAAAREKQAAEAEAEAEKQRQLESAEQAAAAEAAAAKALGKAKDVEKEEEFEHEARQRAESKSKLFAKEDAAQQRAEEAARELAATERAARAASKEHAKQEEAASNASAAKEEWESEPNLAAAAESGAQEEAAAAAAAALAAEAEAARANADEEAAAQAAAQKKARAEEAAAKAKAEADAAAAAAAAAAAKAKAEAEAEATKRAQTMGAEEEAAKVKADADAEAAAAQAAAAAAAAATAKAQAHAAAEAQEAKAKEAAEAQQAATKKQEQERQAAEEEEKGQEAATAAAAAAEAARLETETQQKEQQQQQEQQKQQEQKEQQQKQQEQQEEKERQEQADAQFEADTKAIISAAMEDAHTTKLRVALYPFDPSVFGNWPFADEKPLPLLQGQWVRLKTFDGGLPPGWTFGELLDDPNQKGLLPANYVGFESDVASEISSARSAAVSARSHLSALAGEVTAIWSFDASVVEWNIPDFEPLSFEENARIMVIEGGITGWGYGYVVGDPDRKKGLFPENYVRAADATPLTGRSQCTLGATGQSFFSVASQSSLPPDWVVRALYDYDAATVDFGCPGLIGLSLKRGDRLKLLEMPPQLSATGWVFGHHLSQPDIGGFFPASFVKRAPASEQVYLSLQPSVPAPLEVKNEDRVRSRFDEELALATQSLADQQREAEEAEAAGPSPSTSKLRVVLFDFNPSSPGEQELPNQENFLPLVRGQWITLKEYGEELPPGWCFGEMVGDDSQFGLFPENFVGTKSDLAGDLVALWGFNASMLEWNIANYEPLCFEANTHIMVLDRPTDVPVGWGYGYVAGLPERKGLFPENYVQSANATPKTPSLADGSQADLGATDLSFASRASEIIPPSWVVQALFDFDASQVALGSENLVALSLKKGDRLKLLEMPEELSGVGWLFGHHMSQPELAGFFPASFVKRASALEQSFHSQESSQAVPGEATRAQLEEALSIVTKQSQMSSGEDDPVFEVVRVALWDFELASLGRTPYKNESFLPLKRGQRVRVRPFEGDLPIGWTYGELVEDPSKFGLLPEEYLGTEGDWASEASAGRLSSKVGSVIAIWAFDASTMEWDVPGYAPLSFEEGARIVVLDPADDVPLGWGYGYLDGDEGRKGLFPENYVMNPSRAQSGSPSRSELGATGQSLFSMSTSKSLPAKWVVTAKLDFDAATVNLGSPELVALSLKAGDRLKLLQLPRQLLGSGWLYGQHLSRPESCGFFPQNYVKRASAMEQKFLSRMPSVPTLLEVKDEDQVRARLLEEFERAQNKLTEQGGAEEEVVRVALWDFDPTTLGRNPFEDEQFLPLARGQRVRLLPFDGNLPDGWVYGELVEDPSKKGLLPGDFLGTQSDLASEASFGRLSSRVGCVIALWAFDASSLEWDFSGYEPLSFEEGAQIIVLDAPSDVSNGWGYGYVAGEPDRKGLFPENYVQDQGRSPSVCATRSNLGATGGSLFSMDTAKSLPAKWVVIARFDFDAASVDLGSPDLIALNLKVGDRIKLLQMPPQLLGSGWLYGHRLAEPEVCGFFPESFIKRASASEQKFFSRMPSTPSLLKVRDQEQVRSRFEEERAAAEKNIPVEQQEEKKIKEDGKGEKSEAKKKEEKEEEKQEKENSNILPAEEKEEVKKEEVNNEEAAPVPPFVLENNREEVVVALYDFDPKIMGKWPYRDEQPLGLQRGQHIRVREVPDGTLPPGWCYGQLVEDPTQSGLFPGNYVGCEDDLASVSDGTRSDGSKSRAGEVVAIWGFDATSLEWNIPGYQPLSFEENAQIVVLEAPENCPVGWGYGYLLEQPERRGLFPENYVQGGGTTPFSGRSRSEFGATGTSFASAFSVQSVPADWVVKVLFEWDADSIDLGSPELIGLSLKKGERVKLRQMPPQLVGSGWLYGHRLADPNSPGLFPEAYVKRASALEQIYLSRKPSVPAFVEVSDEPSARARLLEELAAAKDRIATLEAERQLRKESKEASAANEENATLRVALFSFDPSSIGDRLFRDEKFLQFVRGQWIILKEFNGTLPAGWSYGELIDDKDSFGLFPTDYVGLEGDLSASEDEQSEKATTAAANADGAVKVVYFDFDPASLQGRPSKDAKFLRIYRGQHVRLKEFSGDLPTGWNYGELVVDPSQSGLFPANFVGVEGDVVTQSSVGTKGPMGEVIALWSFDASTLEWSISDYDPLIFQENELIILLETPDDAPVGWGYGYVANRPERKGLFPQNYVQDAAEIATERGSSGGTTPVNTTPPVVEPQERIEEEQEQRNDEELEETDEAALLQALVNTSSEAPDEYEHEHDHQRKSSPRTEIESEEKQPTDTGKLSMTPAEALLPATAKFSPSDLMEPDQVFKVEYAGVPCWVVRLQKEWPDEKYGFTHASEACAFARERVASAASKGQFPEVLVVRRVHEEGLIRAWNRQHPEAAVLPTDRIYRINDAVSVEDMQKELTTRAVDIHIARYPEHFQIRVSMGSSVGLEGLGLQLRPSRRAAAAASAQQQHQAKPAGLGATSAMALTVASAATATSTKTVRPPSTTAAASQKTYSSSESSSASPPKPRQEVGIAWINRKGAIEEWSQQQMAQGLFHLVPLRGMRIEGVNEVRGDSESLRAELEKATGDVVLHIRRAELARAAFRKICSRAQTSVQRRRHQRTESRRSTHSDGPEPDGYGSRTPNHASGGFALPPVPKQGIPNGSTVMVVKLQARPESNGTIATVVTFIQKEQKYIIQPEGSDTIVKIKPDNLMLANLCLPGEIADSKVAAAKTSSATASPSAIAAAAMSASASAGTIRSGGAKKENEEEASTPLTARGDNGEDLEQKQAWVSDVQTGQQDWKTAMFALRTINKSKSTSHFMQDECEAWEVSLRKVKGQKLGFAITSAKSDYQEARGKNISDSNEGPELLRVKEVSQPEKSTEAWAETSPLAKISKYDRVAAVNDKTTIEAMREELKQEGEITLKMIRYPEHFYADLILPTSEQGESMETTLSIGFSYERVSSSSRCEFEITKVNPIGLLELWNKREVQQGLYHFVVTPGMRIEAVNEVEGDFERMEEELQKATAPRRLRLRRAEGELNGSSSRGSSKLSHLGGKLMAMTAKGLGLGGSKDGVAMASSPSG